MHLMGSYSSGRKNIDRIESCKKLCDVTITSQTGYRHELKSFFAVFGSTIQLLTLNIKTDEDQFPLTQFEDDFLEKILI